MSHHDKPLKPTDKWRNNNIIREFKVEAQNELAAKIAAKEAQKSVEELVTERADLVASQSLHDFLKIVDIVHIPTKKLDALQSIYRINRDKLKDWSKDDLVIQCAFMLACATLPRIESELI